MPKVTLDMRVEVLSRFPSLPISFPIFFYISTSQTPGIPNEASRKDEIIVKNVTLWKRRQLSFHWRAMLFNSVRYKVAFLFLAVIHYTLHLFG